MQIANSLAYTGGTLHKVYHYWKLLSPSKRRRLNASLQFQKVDRLNFFTPFLSHLYNVEKLDSKPKCVDETSRISGCFSRNCFQENYFFLGNTVHAVSMTTSPQDIYPREKSKGLWQKYDDFQLMTIMWRWATGKLTTTHNSVPVEIFQRFTSIMNEISLSRSRCVIFLSHEVSTLYFEKMYKPIPRVAS